ncbi:MAG: cyclic nucleotide-binding domain-containing protein [Candidatus Caldarchaeum sp.]|nr:cyclic nucleotide-binding domain-containing protein [Candidatus Caldarchaeum sp.]MCX8200846.1 cyclic nucleotide-binding domain-containing protein [Candidatus Caldarchaeum sp.]MDW8435981.1 cyclic nucleotide-binding domain-containing protein [Candidatus Caldarchaeum sp.]
MSHVELVTLLKDHPFTKGFPEEKVNALASIASLSRFTAGQKIFEENDVHRKLYLIVYGMVALYFYVPGRGEFRFETLGPGEVLGWSSLVPPYRKTAGATVVENTLAISFDSEKILRMIEEDKSFGCEIYKKIVEIVGDRLKAARLRLLDVYGKAEVKPE